MLGQQFQLFWDRAKWARYAFVGGILVGVVLGWAFHGIISLVLRFSLVLLFLVPLAAALYFWWRASRRDPGAPPPDHPIATWETVGPGRPADPYGPLDYGPLDGRGPTVVTTATGRPRPTDGARVPRPGERRRDPGRPATRVIDADYHADWRED